MSSTRKNNKLGCREKTSTFDTFVDRTQTNNFKDALIGNTNLKEKSFEETWPELIKEKQKCNLTSNAQCIHYRHGHRDNSLYWESNLERGSQKTNYLTKASEETHGQFSGTSTVRSIDNKEKIVSPENSILANFPTLTDSVGKRKPIVSQNKIKPLIIETPVFTSEQSLTNAVPTKPLRPMCTVHKEKVKHLFKKPHKKDPININVIEAIQLAASKKLKKKEVKVKEKIAHRLNYGNSLDSDRPVRKRGKVRLVPKKRPVSRIKQAILLARVQRNNQEDPNSTLPNIASAECHLQELLADAVVELKKEFYRAKCIPTTEADLEKKHNFNVVNESTMIAKNHIHSRKFRSYCNNIISKDLVGSINKLVISLRDFQDRVYKSEPLKFKMKRRYVCGFKETIKYLRYDELKLIIMATNLEICQGDPMNEMVQNIIETANTKCVPCAFAGTSSDLGYWTIKKTRISVIGILNYMGAEDIFKTVISHLEKAKFNYEEKLKFVQQELGFNSSTDSEQNIEDIIKTTMLLKLGPDKESKSK